MWLSTEHALDLLMITYYDVNVIMTLGNITPSGKTLQSLSFKLRQYFINKIEYNQHLVRLKSFYWSTNFASVKMSQISPFVVVIHAQDIYPKNTQEKIILY
jgi:hypothetical protein